jgi:hypothetical protein
MECRGGSSAARWICSIFPHGRSFVSVRRVNFLVTGCAGFIGSLVCERLLHSGHQVWALDDLNAFYDPQLKRRNIREIPVIGEAV